MFDNKPTPLNELTPHAVALTNLQHDLQHAMQQLSFHADGGRKIPTAFATGQILTIGKAIMQEARHIEKLVF